MSELSGILQYATRKLGEIEANIYKPIAALECEAYATAEPVSFSERESGRRIELNIGDKWGENIFDCAWMHFKGAVPQESLGSEIVVRLDADGELLIVNAEGEPVRGLTNVSSEYDRSLGKPGKTIAPLSEVSPNGYEIDFWADAGYNDLFGKQLGSGALKTCEICAVQGGMRRLYYDLEALTDLAGAIDERSARYALIVRAIDRALQMLTDMTDERATAASLALAGELERTNGDYGLTLSAVGHAHMDLMWLWPQRETVRKGLRTFATALRNMDKYGDYVFGASQPQLYDWVKAASPKLYEQIKQRVSDGRWEPQGAMWVEADVMMASGEALVRQLLYGKRFWMSEFGLDVTTLWLPDDFGFSPQLPQLMKLSGVQYFMNTRAARMRRWRFPYKTFWWQGLNGDRVLTHVPPEATYNSAALPHSALKAEREFSETGLTDGALMLYGIGDGGGGPGEEHLERLARERNLAGMPPIINEKAETFFERTALNADALPTWSGEIFVDNYQGTYTSQLEIKRLNRAIENRLRICEMTLTAMMLHGAEYSHAELERVWKQALLYQFHDVLPGSSIGRVYDEAKAGYAEMQAELDRLMARSWADEAGLEVVINPHAWTVDMWLDAREGVAQGEALRMTLPPMSATSTVSARSIVLPELTATDDVLENDRLRLTFDDRGRITGILDKRLNQQILSAPGNQLNVYDDDGDAWRLGENALKQRSGAFMQYRVSSEVDGARCRRQALYRYGASTLTQTIILTVGSARVDFETEIDWNESARLLRAEFPVDMRAGRFLCDTQFGYIERPTQRNTPMDAGMFEVNALKWVDLNQSGSGVALMLDGGYGHACQDSVMSVSLVRAPSYPDPNADRGKHTVRYAIYPHGGDITDVIRQAYTFHQPPRTARGATFGPLCWLDTRSVVLDTVKVAEDSADIVLRMYECTGAPCTAHVKTGFDIKTASVCDLLERVISPLEADTDGLMLRFDPFEVKTVAISW